MRTYIPLLIAFLCSINVNAQLTNGLIAHWDFSNNFNDLSGNGNHGTTSNNITFVSGKAGGANTAANFNGTNSYISVPYSSSLNTARFTITAMVRPKGYYGGTCHGNIILERGPYLNNGSYAFTFFENPYDSDNCNNQDTSKNVFAGNCGTAAVSNINWRYSPNIVSNTWYCATLVFDSTYYRVYVDGVLKTTVPVNSGKMGGPSTNGLYIGASFNANNLSNYQYWFNGDIDDLRVYNRVLSGTEVAQYCGLFDTTVYINQSFIKDIMCGDDTFHLNYGVTKLFNSGNVFTAQLSDATGSFASPVTIGSVTSNTAGTIICTVPSGLTPATGYRVRILASSPGRMSDVSHPITAHATLYPSVTIAVNPSGPVNKGTFITFTATPTDVGPLTPSYEWYRNGQLITGATTNTWTVNTLSDGDSVHAIVYSKNKCPIDQNASSNKIVAQIITSVYDLNLENLSLYPNPNNGQFVLTATDVTNSSLKLEVLNTLGQILYNKTVAPENKNLKTTIDVGYVAAGIYLLRITADGNQQNIRFRVE